MTRDRPMTAIDRTLHAIDATLTATTQEPAMTTDRIPAPRADHLTTVEQLRREVATLTTERDTAYAELDHAWAAVTRTGVTGPGSLGDRIDAAAEALTRLHTDLATARRTITSQAEQLRANGTLICRLRDLDEQADRIAAWRDRAWADHDTASREHDPNCHTDEQAHWTDCECWCHDTITAPAQDAADGTRDVIGHPCEGGTATDALGGAEAIRPADWEQRAIDAITDAWTHVEDEAAISAQRLAEIAVEAIIDAGLAGPGGRCRQCGTTCVDTAATNATT